MISLRKYSLAFPGTVWMLLSVQLFNLRHAECLVVGSAGFFVGSICFVVSGICFVVSVICFGGCGKCLIAGGVCLGGGVGCVAEAQRKLVWMLDWLNQTEARGDLALRLVFFDVFYALADVVCVFAESVVVDVQI